MGTFCIMAIMDRQEISQKMRKNMEIIIFMYSRYKSSERLIAAYYVLTYCIQEGSIFIKGGLCDMHIVKVFASNLKKYRTQKGLSQETFAEMSGLHRTYISAIEREKRSIALDNIQKIANTLNIDTYLLFVDKEISDRRDNDES